MTTNGFRSDNERLLTGATQLTAAGEQARQIAARLQRELAALGECWGADAIGRSFAQRHVPAAQSTMARLDELSEQLHDVGRRFADTAAAYQQVEHDNAARLRGTEG
ncbi:WXG100 family type VII secretion target [Goodfellowiella coeruleoviolacea]|uniref:ESAT-6-like protein n=1 Tax=Goodfellowiella coeruleoviolacea TaxID=334858 RepID=A0AAE3GMG7_9PSEU|nr:DUF2563 family protein [Goodfellowiella coeruleoviolacea]MCP2169989.1 Protein of unknown function (DUF2563) [Goodfellowiella coeruleoviolacea]